MTQIDVSKRLAIADHFLSDAIEKLLTLTSPAHLGQDALRRVQVALAGIHPAAVAAADRASTTQALRRIDANVGVAKKLLESAAALYFGEILSRGFVNSEYRPNGESSNFGGGCLRTEG